MQQAVPIGTGAMVAVMGGSVDQVRELCNRAADGEVLTCANFNAPGQIVVSGHATAVERMRAAALGTGMKIIPLKVSAPFHCSLMAPAARIVGEALSRVSISAPRVPVIVNVEAQAKTRADEITELLVRQVDSPVLWEPSVRLMADAGVVKALEIGPGNVLAGLVQRTDKRIAVRSVSSVEGVERAGQFFN
jgi:[acyl-carrier-protein] S-malonyltransferase